MAKNTRAEGRFSGSHSDYRVTVEGLPPSLSWQQLKDFAREAGEVIYADVDRKGGGIVEFRSESDMTWALKNLNGQRIRSNYVGLGSLCGLSS